MIRIACNEKELENKIRAKSPNWKHWREIKPVFLELQHFKCAYCERFISGDLDSHTGRRHNFEQEIEHFRPKKTPKRWAVPSLWQGAPKIESGPDSGYEWLEFEPWNYVAACITCNRTYKGSYFPVAAPIDYSVKPDLAHLQEEKAFLIYPLGELDGDPESLIQFLGPTPLPHSRLLVGSHDYWRAKVTIELLGLDNDGLNRERARLIETIAVRWAISLSVSGITAPHIKNVIPSHEHASCCRCFIQLCNQNPSMARHIALTCSSPPSQQIIGSLWKTNS